MTAVTRLNAMDAAAARAALAGCCAAPRWVEAMLARRPWGDDGQLLTAADEAWSRMGESDWLEAFAAHPLIGDVDSLRRKYAATKATAAGEQSGVAGAADDVLSELARLNREYRDHFGFIFIVFATGKSAEEMLAILRRRIENSRAEELRNAAAEQLKITRLRLEKLATAE
jgi:2-oxo-4-hydroxy-4-carboxy-5-ureidoimidazoline decarboxylase